jgi:hypothetical protein
MLCATQQLSITCRAAKVHMLQCGAHLNLCCSPAARVVAAAGALDAAASTKTSVQQRAYKLAPVAMLHASQQLFTCLT